MKPSSRPAGPAVQLHYYPNGFDVDHDIVVDTAGERWLCTPHETAPWYGPLDLAYVEEAEIAQFEALALAAGSPS